MSFQIYNWLEKYVHEVVSTFGYRIWFIGVQGSYARGEATEDSDIDIVLILDTLLPADLRIYRGMLNRLPYREESLRVYFRTGRVRNLVKSRSLSILPGYDAAKRKPGRDCSKIRYERCETCGSYRSLQSVSCGMS